MMRPEHRQRRRPFRRRPVVRIRGLTINRLLPNILTTLALCAGLTGIRYAVHERWEQAVTAILVAAVLDGLDGRVARLLRGSSKFGATLLVTATWPTLVALGLIYVGSMFFSVRRYAHLKRQAALMMGELEEEAPAAAPAPQPPDRPDQPNAA
jgi:hypothetical protein